MRKDGRGDVSRYRGGTAPGWIYWEEFDSEKRAFFRNMRKSRLSGAIRIVYELATMRYICSSERELDPKIHKVPHIKKYLLPVYKLMVKEAKRRGMNVMDIEIKARRKCGV